MTKPISQPIKTLSKRQIQEIEPVPISEGNFSSGMISEVDPADLPPQTLREIRNARIYLDKLYPSPGLSQGSLPTKPNSNKILKIYGFQKNDGSSHTYRFTKSTIHKLGVGSWSAITGTLTGGDLDRIQVSVAFDVPVFTNNGVEPIQAINVGAGTFGNLGNAKRYKYNTVFFDRVVGLNLAGPVANPIEVGRSGQNNPDEFDPSVDLSAGADPLIESPGDLNDFITGGIGFSDVMVVFRQRSIWIARKTAIPENPFYYSSDVSGKGCSLPYTITVVGGNLIAFADYRTRDVYLYEPGSRQVIPIGTSNQSRMIDVITDADAPFGAYDPVLDQYHLCIPSASSNTVNKWIYDFKTKSWTFEEIDRMSSQDFPETSGSNLKIIQLAGKVSQLTGKIQDLGVISSSIPVDYTGFDDGELKREDSGTNVTSILISKAYTNRVNARRDIAVNAFSFDFYITDGITIALYYSKNDGNTWHKAKQKTYDGFSSKTPIKFTYTKLHVASRLTWKLVITGKNWELINHVIEPSDSGTAKPTA